MTQEELLAGYQWMLKSFYKYPSFALRLKNLILTMGASGYERMTGLTKMAGCQNPVQSSDLLYLHPQFRQTKRLLERRHHGAAQAPRYAVYRVFAIRPARTYL